MVTVVPVDFDLEESILQAHVDADHRDEQEFDDTEGLGVNSIPPPPDCCAFRDLTILDATPPSIIKTGPAYALGPLAQQPEYDAKCGAHEGATSSHSGDERRISEVGSQTGVSKSTSLPMITLAEFAATLAAADQANSMS